MSTITCQFCGSAAQVIPLDATLIRVVFGNPARLACPSPGCSGFKSHPHVGFHCHGCGQTAIQHTNPDPFAVKH